MIFGSVQFSHSVMSDSSLPHEPQNARPPCPSPTPGVHPNSCPGGSDGKASAYNAGDLGSIPGLGRSPGEGISYPLQYSGLKEFMDCIVHAVAKSRT